MQFPSLAKECFTHFYMLGFIRPSVTILSVIALIGIMLRTTIQWHYAESHFDLSVAILSAL